MLANQCWGLVWSLQKKIGKKNCIFYEVLGKTNKQMFSKKSSNYLKLKVPVPETDTGR